MKVLFWSETFPPYVGGIEVLASQLLPALAARGHTFHVWTSHYYLDLPDADRLDGIPVTRFPLRHAVQEADPATMIGLRRQLAALKEELDVDLVHVFSMGPSLLFHQDLARVAPVPCIVTVHNALPQQATANRNGLVQRTLRSASWVTACSRALLAELRRIVPDIESRSSAIVNGVRTPEGELAQLPFDPPVLVCLGRLAPQKGLDVALSAFAAVADRHPTARLVIAGDGPERDRLKAQARQEGTAERVEFTGFVPQEEVGMLLERATLLLMPSRWEGLPVASLEAAIHGRPIVGTAVQGLSEVVLDGKTGLVVPPDDPAALAAAVDRLLSSPQTAVALGKRAAEHARDRFSLDACVDGYDALYSRIGRRAVRA